MSVVITPLAMRAIDRFGVPPVLSASMERLRWRHMLGLCAVTLVVSLLCGERRRRKDGGGGTGLHAHA